MTRTLYTALLRLLFPLVFLMLVVRGWRNPPAAVPWAERLAFRRPPRGARDPVWIHAVSLGEVQAAAALVARLQQRTPAPPVLFTVGTRTGMERARAAFRERLAAQDGSLTLAFAPLDFPGAVRRFLDHFRPSSLVLVEMEIWPNLLAACAARGIPAALASARLSAPSVQRYRRFASRLMARSLESLARVAAQSEADAARLVELGAPSARVSVAGNLKFDYAPPPGHAARSTALRAALGERRVWVAGSTQEGEEAACIKALRAITARGRVPLPLLVLVPRMPGRFEAVAQWLASHGVAFARRSTGVPPLPSGCEVLLVDTLGELLDFYGVADLAFVGGTLAPIGGHNLLEPAALGVPVLCGPHTFNAPQVATLLGDAGALRLVDDADALATEVEALLSDDAARSAAGAAGRAVVEANRGAVERTLEFLAPVIDVRARAASGSAPVPAQRP